MTHPGLKQAYFALFVSLHSGMYGIRIWDHVSSVHIVLALQKRAVRVISNVTCLEHCKPLCHCTILYFIQYLNKSNRTLFMNVIKVELFYRQRDEIKK